MSHAYASVLHGMHREPGDTTAEDGLPAKYAAADHLDASYRSHVAAYRVPSKGSVYYTSWQAPQLGA